MMTPSSFPDPFVALRCMPGDQSHIESCAPAVAQAARYLLSLPFDTAREHSANAVRAGLVKGSLLASGNFERGLDALERLSYGPFARRV